MSSLTLSKEEEKRLKGLGFLNNKGTDNFSARILTVNGKVTAAQHRAMADAAETFGNGILTFTTRQTVEVQGIPYEKLEEFQEFVENAGMAIGGTGAKVRPVVSCKGTTCQYGLLDSFAISEEIHKRFYEGYHDVKLPHKFKIAVGGCPNNCVKPNLNDLGIIGQRIPHFKAELCKGCKKCSVEAVCPMGAAKVSDKKLHIDDPVGAVGVHWANGVWGTIAVGFFATGKGDTVNAFADGSTYAGLFYGGGFKLLGIQVLGIVAIDVYAAIMMVIVFPCWKDLIP